jgi:hypothetical protein
VEVVAGEDGVGVTAPEPEIVAAHAMLGLEMADDGGPAAEFALVRQIVPKRENQRNFFCRPNSKMSDATGNVYRPVHYIAVCTARYMKEAIDWAVKNGGPNGD